MTQQNSANSRALRRHTALHAGLPVNKTQGSTAVSKQLLLCRDTCIHVPSVGPNNGAVERKCSVSTHFHSGHIDRKVRERDKPRERERLGEEYGDIKQDEPKIDYDEQGGTKWGSVYLPVYTHASVASQLKAAGYI